MKLTKPMMTVAVVVCSAVLFFPGPLNVLADQGAATKSAVKSSGSSGTKSKLDDGADLMTDGEREAIERQEDEERRKQTQQRAPDPPPRSPVAPSQPSSPAAAPLPAGD